MSKSIPSMKFPRRLPPCQPVSAQPISAQAISAQPTSAGPRSRSLHGARGFTLVELLVVISIIGLLAAIVTTAVMEAIAIANRTVIAAEMNSIGMALEQVKIDFGSYPPSPFLPPGATTNEVFENYFQRKFTYYDMSKIATDMNTAIQQVDSEYDYDSSSRFRADLALVFWLVGFSGDPENPLLNHGERMLGQESSTPYYEFDRERLQNGTFAAKGTAQHDKRTFYYIDSRNYAIYGGQNTVDGKDFLPYHRVLGAPTENDFYKPDSYQIVYPGKDGTLGTGGGIAVDDVPYDGFDKDNMTSFSGNQTMFDFSDK